MRIHFIAIGGSAMHNLALALHNKGHKVTGSDDEIFEPSKSRLQKLGLLPDAFGWFSENISLQIDAVVLGMHAKKDNPELLKAQEIGVKIYSYPEFLYEQTKNKKRVVIGGSHGKTTTTAIILHVLKKLGKTFDYMVGAQLDGFDTMVEFNEESEYAIFEGDEYLTSPIDLRPKFHLYKPHVALLTGIAWDHINVFPTFENYCEQFSVFANLIEPNGSLIYFEDDSELVSIAENCRKDIKTIAYNTHSHSVANSKTNLHYSNNIVPIKVFGKHNLQNVKGAYFVCKEIGVSDSEFYEAIQSFNGASKRLQLLAYDSSTQIYLDFAHSPSKLKATVNAVKEQFPKKILISVMELHTFSSLNKKFLTEYEGSLNSADKSFVYFSEHAIKLKQMEQLDAKVVKDAFKNEGLIVVTERDVLVQYINELDVENAIVLFLSSGDFSGIDLKEFAKELIENKNNV